MKNTAQSQKSRAAFYIRVHYYVRQQIFRCLLLCYSFNENVLIPEISEIGNEHVFTFLAGIDNSLTVNAILIRDPICDGVHIELPVEEKLSHSKRDDLTCLSVYFQAKSTRGVLAEIVQIRILVFRAFDRI